EAGINYFDTAALYGDGESERNLGRVLAKLKPDVVVGTKVRVAAEDMSRIGAAIGEALDASLKRMGRDSVDLFQLHNPIETSGRAGSIKVEAVLDEVVPAFEKLKRAGKIRFAGITATGESGALRRVVDAQAFDTAQVMYNMLNPSAGGPMPPNAPGQDYGRLLEHTKKARMGVIGIRALAGGALSGSEARHELAMQVVEPIGSGRDFRSDVERARRFEMLIREGFANSLTEAAMRFTISHDGMTTMIIGYSTLDHLEQAIAAAEKGPLPRAALERVAALGAQR
ncbi:MAG: aldo/keto reductase, partial [Alphaproteobacteria bacterium]|nr:aldo/keto reductase [Alphaproteobacteria bacterium]